MCLSILATFFMTIYLTDTPEGKRALFELRGPEGAFHYGGKGMMTSRAVWFMAVGACHAAYSHLGGPGSREDTGPGHRARL